jgi:hypothetical protein
VAQDEISNPFLELHPSAPGQLSGVIEQRVNSGADKSFANVVAGRNYTGKFPCCTDRAVAGNYVVAQ